MKARILILTLAITFAGAPALNAQFDRYQAPRASFGVSFLVGEPQGDFARFADEGYGADFMARVPLDPAGIVSLRADAGFLIYGYESKRVCVAGVGCRVEARLQTTNSIFFGGIGPELALPFPFVRPYVNATMGFGYFSTNSSLEDLWGGENYFDTQNFGDGTFSWGIGWGAELQVSRGRVPIAIDVGARYRQNGVMEYLTEGDIVDHPDGSVTLFPNVSEANLISYRFGVTIGLPRRGDDDEPRKGRSRKHW
jgi:hypothetical protein